MRIHPLVPVPLSLPLRSHIQCTHTCACAHKLCSTMEDKMGMCILCWRCNYSLQTGSHPIKELTIYTYMHTQTHILWVRLCFFSQFEIWNGTYGFVRVLSRMVTSQFLKEDSITILKQNEGRTREEGAQSNGMRQRAYVSFCVKIKPSNNKNHVQWIK